jgi:hypothetical protein
LARPETCMAEKKLERRRVVSSGHWQSAQRLVTVGHGACGKAVKKGRGSRGGGVRPGAPRDEGKDGRRPRVYLKFSLNFKSDLTMIWFKSYVLKLQKFKYKYGATGFENMNNFSHWSFYKFETEFGLNI